MEIKKLKTMLKYLKLEEKSKDERAISNCIKISFEKYVTAFTAMDSNLIMRTATVYEHNDETFDVYISRVKLERFLKLVKGNTIEFTKESAIIGVYPYDVRVEPYTIDPYSYYSELVSQNKIAISASQMKTIQSLVLPSVSADETRYVIDGVAVNTEDREGYARFIGTDGRTLAYCDIPCEIDEKSRSSRITKPTLYKNIPENAVTYVLSEGVAKGEKVSVMRCETNDLALIVYAVDIAGQYPNYQRVVPAKLSKAFTFKTEKLKKLSDECFRQFTLTAERNSIHKAHFELDKENSKFKVTLFMREASDDYYASKPIFETSIDIDYFDGVVEDTFEFYVNYTYFERGIDQDSRESVLLINDTSSAFEIESYGRDTTFVAMLLQR